MHTGRNPSLGTWVTILLLVGVLSYPLSFGPAYWLVDRGFFGFDFFMTSYAPLISLMHRNEPASVTLSWYAFLGCREESYGPLILSTEILIKDPKTRQIP